MSVRGLATRYAPITAALDALRCLDDRQRILTHTFSNGGAFHLISLAKMLSPLGLFDLRAYSLLIQHPAELP
ncbi:hypothetical protein K438DRAFT_1963162 [Mycena galopus ATCC 62051]|nr:hypothetical protein K438DRAFT_1963162 [Mycena galopus ATCC 62051]